MRRSPIVEQLAARALNEDQSWPEGGEQDGVFTLDPTVPVEKQFDFNIWGPFLQHRIQYVNDAARHDFQLHERPPDEWWDEYIWQLDQIIQHGGVLPSDRYGYEI